MSDSQANEGPTVIERPIEDVKRYARRRYALFIAHLVVGAAFLFAMIAGASSVVSREAKSIAGPNAFLLTVFFYFAGFSLAYLVVTLPRTFSRGHILEHQFGLSTQTFARGAGRRWAARPGLALLRQFVQPAAGLVDVLRVLAAEEHLVVEPHSLIAHHEFLVVELRGVEAGRVQRFGVPLDTSLVAGDGPGVVLGGAGLLGLLGDDDGHFAPDHRRIGIAGGQEG